MKLTEIQDYISEKLDTNISVITSEAIAKFGSISGDVSPEIAERLEYLQSEIVGLLSLMIMKNIPKEPTEFEKVRDIYNLVYHFDEYEGTRKNYVNHFINSWDNFQKAYHTIRYLIEIDNLTEGQVEDLALLENQVNSAFLIDDKKQAFESLYSLSVLYNESIK